MIKFFFITRLIVLCGCLHMVALQALFERVEVLQAMTAGDFDKAHDCMKHIIIDSPDTPDLLYDAGVVAYRTKDYAQAELYAKRAADRLNENDFLWDQALFNAGNAAVFQKKLREALAYYDAILAKKPGHEKALHNAAIVRKMIEEEEKKKQEKEKDPQNDKNKDDAKNQEGNDQKDKNDQGGQQKNQNKQKNDGSDNNDQSNQHNKQNEDENSEEQDVDSSENGGEKNDDNKPSGKKSSKKNSQSSQENNEQSSDDEQDESTGEEKKSSDQLKKTAKKDPAKTDQEKNGKQNSHEKQAQKGDNEQDKGYDNQAFKQKTNDKKGEQNGKNGEKHEKPYQNNVNTASDTPQYTEETRKSQGLQEPGEDGWVELMLREREKADQQSAKRFMKLLTNQQQGQKHDGTHNW